MKTGTIYIEIKDVIDMVTEMDEEWQKKKPIFIWDELLIKLTENENLPNFCKL